MKYFARPLWTLSGYKHKKKLQQKFDEANHRIYDYLRIGRNGEGLKSHDKKMHLFEEIFGKREAEETTLWRNLLGMNLRVCL